MPPFHTVIPLHNVGIEPNASQPFAEGFVLTAVPSWLRSESMLKELNSWDRDGVRDATHALVATYDALYLDEPDPAWNGPNPKCIQETKYEMGVLANLALWFSRPSPVCFTIVVHAPEHVGRPIAQRITSHSPLLCHPGHVDRRLRTADLPLAATLHSSLALIERDSALWTAVRSTWAGLQMNNETIRYLLFWVAIEALFGPEDAREITYRLAQRVGFFLGRDRSDARQLFGETKKGYGFRSKIVHGRWSEDAASEYRMLEVEQLLRRLLLKILLDPALVENFCAKGREKFLDELVFSGAV